MSKKIHAAARVIFIILLIWCLGMAPLSTFVFVIPSAAVVVSLIALIAAGAVFAATGKYKKRRKIILTALGVVAALCGAVFGMLCNPYSNSVTFIPCGYTLRGETVLTAAQAKSDIKQELGILKKVHPAFIDGVPAEVDNAYREALALIDERGSVTVYELARIAEGIVSVMNDAHTNVYTSFATEDQRYLKDYARYATDGYRITGINGASLSGFYRANKRLFSCEAESRALHQIENSANSAEALAYLGIDINDGVTLTWTSENDEFTENYAAGDFLPYSEYMELNAEYYKNKDKSGSPARYELFDDYAVLTVSSCVYNDEYKNTVRNMFTKVRENGVKSVIIDLRGNGGGSSLVADEFIKYLGVDSFKTVSERLRLGFFMTAESDPTVKNARYDDLLFSGDIYCLTDSGSFSSAMLFALYIKDNGLGLVIGEAPGNAANSCGDISTFALGNSRLRMSCSTKIFRRAVPENGDFVEPDIVCGGKEALTTAVSVIENK